MYTFKESDDAFKSFKKAINEVGGRNLTKAELKDSLTYFENKIWIERMINEAHTIVILEDIKHPSVFVEMELETIKKYLNSLRKK